MKVGDLIKNKLGKTAVVVYVNKDGGTIQALGVDGAMWLVTSECEVVSEGM